MPSIKMGNDHGVGFIRRHVGFINDRRAMDGRVGLLFVGDSITDGWRNFGPRGGRDVFEQAYGKYRPLNIGIGGDRTQHVLWRLDAGEVEGISPKVAVLMIGTNNLGSNTNEEIAAADAKIVQELHESCRTPRSCCWASSPATRSPTPTTATASRRSTPNSPSSTTAARP